MDDDTPFDRTQGGGLDGDRDDARPIGGFRPGVGGPGMRGGPLRRNLTEGPITKTLLVFSLPLLGGNALQSLNLTANQIWVSHTLGERAVTALGNSNIVRRFNKGHARP